MQTQPITDTENPYAPPSVENSNSRWHFVRNFFWHTSLIVLVSKSAYWHLSMSSAVGQLHRLQGVVDACGALSVGFFLSKIVNPGDTKRNRLISAVIFPGLFTIGNLRYLAVYYLPPQSSILPNTGLFDYFLVIMGNSYPGLFGYLLPAFVFLCGKGPISAGTALSRRVSRWVRNDMMNPNTFP